MAPKGKDAPKKAVLISGPPGIGKTSASKIICRALGFDVMEVNASDTRGKVRGMLRAHRRARALTPMPRLRPGGIGRQDGLERQVRQHGEGNGHQLRREL